MASMDNVGWGCGRFFIDLTECYAKRAIVNCSFKKNQTNINSSCGLQGMGNKLLDEFYILQGGALFIESMAHVRESFSNEYSYTLFLGGQQKEFN